MTTWAIRVFIFLTVIKIANASEDWPGFRGPNADGAINGAAFAPDRGDLNIAWRAKAGSGYSGVSVVADKAITAFSQAEKDVIVAFDVKSGKELWHADLSPKYAGHDGSHDGPIATPAIQNGKVFALSAWGHLRAFDLNDGKILWSVDIREAGGRAPFYGYAGSPLVANGVVVVLMGGEKGKSIGAFDQQLGKLKWSAGDDTVGYQSPILMTIDGKQRVIAVSDKKMLVLDPESGSVLLDYDHGGDDAALILVPVPLDRARVLLRNKTDSSDLLGFTEDGGKVTAEKIWTAGVFKNSYNPPVYHNGYLYGFNGRVLTCVNAENGETKWKSRGVSDGFVLLVNGNLIIQTKTGSMHVGLASPDGWKETKQIEVFKEISWTPPIYADGAIFSRSHGEVARISVGQSAGMPEPQLGMVLPPKFGAFLSALETATDKKQEVDQFFAEHKESPIIESPDRVIFLYRGPGEDMAIAGDLQPVRTEEPMTCVPGTDLFYYTARLEPDARINYRYVRNFEENIADPHNPRTATDRRGNPISWFAMPAWKEAAHFQEPPESKRGTFESHEIKSKKTNPVGLAKVDVYLPAGYSSSNERYPVLYLLEGALARSQGAIHHTIENLRGTKVRAPIVVFLTEIKTSEGERIPNVEVSRQTSKYFAEEIVPFIDARYRTIQDKESRAISGGLTGGGDAMLIAFEHPDLFGGVAVQSMWPFDVDKAVTALITSAAEKPMRIYMEWGSHDARSPVEGWDVREANLKFVSLLREKGYLPTGGETHESYGWYSWRNRTDRWLLTLFPAVNETQP